MAGVGRTDRRHTKWRNPVYPDKEWSRYRPGRDQSQKNEPRNNGRIALSMAAFLRTQMEGDLRFAFEGLLLRN